MSEKYQFLEEIRTETYTVTQILITEIKQEVENILKDPHVFIEVADEVTAMKLFVCNSKLDYLSKLINELENNLTK